MTPATLTTTTASVGVGGALTTILTYQFPTMPTNVVEAYLVLFTVGVGYVIHSGLGAKLFPKSTPPAP
jgi:hypothetical protein